MYSDDQELLDENPMKVGSELISMHIDPPLPGRLRVPVTISMMKSGVSILLLAPKTIYPSIYISNQVYNVNNTYID